MFNKLVLSLLLLNISFNHFALNENDNLVQSDSHKECTDSECPINNLFNLDSLLSNPEVKEFYESLNEPERENFVLLIKELNIVSSDVLNKLVDILQKYENLVTKFKEVNSYKVLEVVIAFTGTELKSFKKSFDNQKFKEFLTVLSDSEKNEFTALCQEMQNCFKDGMASIVNLFNSFADLKQKYKEVAKKDILIVLGSDQDDALPCEYCII